MQLSSVTIPTKPGSASSQEDAGGEYWVSRQSVHEDSSELGTASFDEFVRGLRDDHTENEMAYTPSVTSIEKILEWDCETDGGFGGGWDSVKMAGEYREIGSHLDFSLNISMCFHVTPHPGVQLHSSCHPLPISDTNTHNSPVSISE